MSKKIRIVLAQLNFCVGDIEGNLAKHIAAATEARDALKADMIVFPELSLTGYPPEDLLLRKDFLQATHEALNALMMAVKDIHCVVGHPHLNSQGLYNSCSVIYNKKILTRYDKQALPNYGVFDEQRYFIPGNAPCVIPIHGIPVGIIICEDLWDARIAQEASNQGARVIVDINASPFEMEKHEQRHALLAKRAKTADTPILYVNMVGQQDELLFDGGSMVVNAQGKITHLANFYEETLLPVDIEVSSLETHLTAIPFSIPSQEQRIYDGLVFGVKDYLYKNNFKGALIGVSGGIDSALTAAIAVDALGKDQVEAVIMPSRFTSELSIEEAMALIHNLSIQYKEISIEPTHQALLTSLDTNLNSLAKENIQARCRGIILMTLSNQSGKIVLTTGNRSEMALGYTTLYGDMCGGLAVLKDIPKTWIYRLANYRNQLGLVIPKRTIDRAPTAELAPNQKDEDALGSYTVLDHILDLYLNQEWSIEEIAAQGIDLNLIKKTVSFIKLNEYKRRQSAIGIRINHKAFGRDRRYPITNGFKG